MNLWRGNPLFLVILRLDLFGIGPLPAKEKMVHQNHQQDGNHHKDQRVFLAVTGRRRGTSGHGTSLSNSLALRPWPRHN